MLLRPRLWLPAMLGLFLVLGCRQVEGPASATPAVPLAVEVSVEDGRAVLCRVDLPEDVAVQGRVRLEVVKGGRLLESHSRPISLRTTPPQAVLELGIDRLLMLLPETPGGTLLPVEIAARRTEFPGEEIGRVEARLPLLLDPMVRIEAVRRTEAGFEIVGAVSNPNEFEISVEWGSGRLWSRKAPELSVPLPPLRDGLEVFEVSGVEERPFRLPLPQGQALPWGTERGFAYGLEFGCRLFTPFGMSERQPRWRGLAQGLRAAAGPR